MKRNDPPASALPRGIQMQAVENPVQTAMSALRAAWDIPGTHKQLAEAILSLPGAESVLAPTADLLNRTPLQTILQERLNELESQRLALLLELDKAQLNMDTYRRSVVERAGKAALQQLKEAEAKAAAANQAAEEAALRCERLQIAGDALAAQLADLQQGKLPEAIDTLLTEAGVTGRLGSVRLLHRRHGEARTGEEIVRSMMEQSDRTGAKLSRNQVVTLIGLLASTQRFALEGRAAAALTLMENAARLMGWQDGFARQSNRDECFAAAGKPNGTPALLISLCGDSRRVAGCTSVILNHAASRQQDAYSADPWPVMPLSLPFVSTDNTEAGNPVMLSALTVDPADPMPVLTPILEQVPVLSGDAMEEMKRFIAVTAPLMDGGFAAACDWAVLLWLVPMMRPAKGEWQTLLAELPMSLSACQ